uniref:Intraflagellar transport protein 81 homolog n=1 Tax=Ciona intestinalis TaxID=7719 RepID=F6UHC9_CIOIN|nr:intraflagellar transport protein 81 homolog [Ciona intestinalis]|eukprot:XP_002126367.1 intraflagellar transport protein 81 homolog [Ciona intestinalis]
MTEEAKLIVELLNKEPFKKNVNLISFHSYGPEQLLQLLNDVLATIDPSQSGDIRDEASDARTQRTLGCLKNLKYTPPPNADVSSFRQGIVLGDKPVINPILVYLLTNLDVLKTRAYLAKYLVKLGVPDELLHDSSDFAMQESWTKYCELQEHFHQMHRELTDLKKQSHGTSEVKTDIKTMEEEKENLMRKVERVRKKAEGTPDFADSLQIAQRMRKEKERGEDIQKKIQQQRRLMQSAEQTLQRKKQQVYEMKQGGANSSPESLISRMQEDNRLNEYLVSEKLPKEIETLKKNVSDLQRVAMEPAISQQDLHRIEDEIEDATSKINRLVEKKMVHGNPAKDKLALFRQQASILSHKKETLAETVQSKREEVDQLENELRQKRATLQELGGEVLKGDDYKKFIIGLRTKSNQYKSNRAELAELRSEMGVLVRTETILQKLNDQSQRKLNVLENKRGVSGFRDTQDELEKVSAMKSDFDEAKHRTLDDMSDMVHQLNSVIQDKKNLLAPVIKELRPMRQRCQEIMTEYNEKKSHYDSVAAGLESNRSQLEHAVAALREECMNHDSRFHYIQSMNKILQGKIDRANNEMKVYTSGDKKKGFREIYSKKIQEQENLAKSLREKQKNVRENHNSDKQQMEMWKDLEALLECKMGILQRQHTELRQIKNPGFTMSREPSQDRMVL